MKMCRMNVLLLEKQRVTCVLFLATIGFFFVENLGFCLRWCWEVRDFCSFEQMTQQRLCSKNTKKRQRMVENKVSISVFSIWFVYCPNEYWHEVASCRICPNKCLKYLCWTYEHTIVSDRALFLIRTQSFLAYSNRFESLFKRFAKQQPNHIEALLFS